MGRAAPQALARRERTLLSLTVNTVAENLLRTSAVILVAAPVVLLTTGAASINTVGHSTPPRPLVTVADQSSIHVEQGWARPTIGPVSTGAAYFTLTTTGKPDRLVGMATPVAASATLHETINDNGVMKMRPVAGLPLTPGKPVTLSPGGYHVMLMGLKGPLKAGDQFPLTLTFQHAAPITVTIQVRAMGMEDHMGHMNHMP